MHKKSVVYLFLIPLILFCYATWQHWRVSHVLERAQYETQIVETASKSPRATLTYRHDGQETEMPAIDAQERAQAYLAENSDWIDAADVELFLARGGMLFAFISLMINAATVALCRFCVAQGQRSQGALLRAFWLCRLLLPFIMAAQLVVGAVYQFSIIFYEVVWAAVTFKPNINAFTIGLYLLMMAGVVFWVFWHILKVMVKCFALFRPMAKPIMGHRLSRHDAPALWQAVEALASGPGAVVPDNIVVGLTDNFYVTANPLLLDNGETVTGQTLYFPLTWAALLSPEEMTAVIGHELGHFSGKDTEFSQRFLPVYDGFSRSLDVLDPDDGKKPYVGRVELRTALYSAHYFLEQFHRLVMMWRQRREHAADEAGAQASSPEALASALLRIVALSGPVNAYLEAVYQAQVQTDNVAATLLTHLSGHPVPDPREYLENEISHPYDSHPSCRARIEALGCSVELAAIQASRPVSLQNYEHLHALFTNTDELARSLTATLTGRIAEQRNAWRDELQTVVQAVSGEKVIYSRRRISRGGVLTIVTFVSMLVAFHADREWQFPPGKREWAGLIITLIFAYFIWLGVRSVLRFWRESKAPLLVLTPQHLIFRELKEPVPFSALTSYLFMAAKKEMMIGLEYKEGYQPPALAGARFRPYRYVNKKERLMLLDADGKLYDADNNPVSQEALMELIEMYFHAPDVKAQLDTMQ